MTENLVLANLLKSVTELSPKISEQALQLGRFDNTVGLVFGIVMALIAYKSYRKSKTEKDGDIYIPIAGFCGLFGFLLIWCTLFQLYKINQTPELYILESILGK